MTMDTTPAVTSVSMDRKDVDNLVQAVLCLPLGLQDKILVHLDPIDITCLGLTSKHLYPIYRQRFREQLPLDALMEWQQHRKPVISDRRQQRDPHALFVGRKCGIFKRKR
ncbi:hypothetical protein FPOAC1_010168 [Fusarium poae]|uniref:hypothetical protein n=1 Tax=Fusarium poae TaxID=36050 RepID=UPI001CE9EADB|nr:hypothetical protein FPOAC1_010168 [Fusarium poae]KAG8665373.1 hypothetical protein FPOAC1_010168 [Fusarium poae]